VPIHENDLLELRPYAFHVCSYRNLPSIRSAGSLLPASHLLKGCSLLPGERRARSVALSTIHGEVVLRDHRPFALGAVEFEQGYRSRDYIAEQLDGRVFFLPEIKGPAATQARPRRRRRSWENSQGLL